MDKNIKLSELLQILKEVENGQRPSDEEIEGYRRILRNSDVVEELEAGNILIIKYSLDDKYYACYNSPFSVVTYIGTYDEYINLKELQELQEEKNNDYNNDDEW